MKMKENNMITCLGLNFSSENERREYFPQRTARQNYLLKKIEAFPLARMMTSLTRATHPITLPAPTPIE